ncbi:quinone-dependent dihydroorotate dehydrogenase [Leifsonia sp. H3M29-4]|uniref:quinone-dependent dihydroorotate dehydrogenase n=1 Tax=Salinibacterium metalliresistens TaxID=3031321 RepID=UPI0023DCBC85|nr:quinone-dependent dihydroorotate dehydrogenase [Salinibacterium metalliresistens]MDF1480184.1 quinone-dependent dihydroorotate dehydrogenase [Salinibacterium metalliresistens]
MYPLIFRLVLARLDAERAHRLGYAVIRVLPGILRPFTRPDAALRVTALGRTFDSPFGVAAGFDKEGAAIRGLGVLGFGHVEVGTITALAQPGNPRPRLFRLIPDRAVINRMGFNNHGAQAAARVIAKAITRRRRPVVGVNIGKSRAVEVDDATADYLASTRLLAPLADYLVVNVSSPNTPGLRGLQELDRLAPLLAAVKAAAGTTPVLVKIAPDLTDDQARRIAQLAAAQLDGIIATNTTLSREGLATPTEVVEAAGAGGLSGPPLAARSLELLSLIRSVVPSGFCVISVGGVETAADVQERLDAGATLVQGYTAFLYRGPLWARQINRGLTRIAANR